jgi:hypothetical protein
MQLFLEVKIHQVKREHKKVAHELPQLASRNVHSTVWLRQYPECIGNLKIEAIDAP